VNKTRGLHRQIRTVIKEHDTMIGKITRWLRSIASKPTPCNKGIYDSSHRWREFDTNEWECVDCGLVVGWPNKDTKEDMGINEMD